MKNALINALLPLFAMSAALFATEKEMPTIPQYDHRMVVFHPLHQGYEYMPKDDLYVGIDLFGTVAYETTSRSGSPMLNAEIRLGRSYFKNGQDHIRPILGGGVYRNIEQIDFYTSDENGFLHIDTLKHPLIAYGMVGCMVEREFNDRISLGLNAKFLLGGIAGSSYDYDGGLYYGADISIPFTIRLGSERQWDLRLEPYALVMNDQTRYIGHRSAFAYRF